jgi:cephalosporin hydroxylase
MNISDQLLTEYQQACNSPGDIHEHLPVMKALADTCHSVTEFGVRWGVSTRAWLASKASKFRLYDIQEDSTVQNLVGLCKQHNIDVEYTIADVLTLDIEPTDLLFIDTSHTYNQLSQELRRHHVRVKKYIVMHDTEHNGTIDEFGNKPALTGALLQFLSEHPEWQVRAHYTNNNGLTVIERRTHF